MDIKNLADHMIKGSAFKEIKNIDKKGKKDLLMKTGLVAAIATVALLILGLLAPMTLLITVPLAAIVTYGAFTYSTMEKTKPAQVKQFANKAVTTAFKTKKKPSNPKILAAKTNAAKTKEAKKLGNLLLNLTQKKMSVDSINTAISALKATWALNNHILRIHKSFVGFGKYLGKKEYPIPGNVYTTTSRIDKAALCTLIKAHEEGLKEEVTAALKELLAHANSMDKNSKPALEAINAVEKIVSK